MQYEFENRDTAGNILENIHRIGAKIIVTQFARGDVDEYYEQVKAEPSERWMAENSTFAAQLAYERTVALKKFYLKILDRDWESDGSKELYDEAKENIDDFISSLDSGIKKLSKRKDVLTEIEIFADPLARNSIPNKDAYYDKTIPRRNKDEQELYSLSQLKKYVEMRWGQLIDDGYSENQAAQIIEDETNKQRAASTYKRWMKPEYNY